MGIRESKGKWGRDLGLCSKRKCKPLYRVEARIPELTRG